MMRHPVPLAAAASFVAALTCPAVRACAPVLVLRNGAVVNLDTRVEVRPGRLPIVLSPARVAALLARQRAALARRNAARLLRIPPHRRGAPQ
jgi:hypothetical protein